MLEFAQRIGSSEGERDGLHWTDYLAGPATSLLNEAFARAELREGATLSEVDPSSGYVFRVLTARGPSAPGEAGSYLAGEDMIFGYAVLAFPVQYGKGGRRSFLLDQTGVLLAADLGEDTATTASAIAAYDPGTVWKRVD